MRRPKIMLLRLVALALTLVLVVPILAACDSESKEPTTTPTSIPTETLTPTVTPISTSEIEEAITIVYEADLSNVDAASMGNVMGKVIQIIERRLEFYGVTKAVVQQQENSQVSVRLIDVKDIDEIIKIIGQTGKLDFRKPKLDAQGNPVIENDDYVWVIATGTASDGQQIELTGEYLESDAQIQFDELNKPQLVFQWKSEAVDAFAEVTTKLWDKPLGIFLDNELISAPIVLAPITEGKVVLTGLSFDEVQRLAIQLNSGALPVNLKFVSSG